MTRFLQNSTAVESSFEGCGDPTAGRAIFVSAGTPTNACHQLRDNTGQPINLTSIDPGNQDLTFTSDETSITSKVLFRDALCTAGTIHETTVTIDSPTSGLVCFEVPSQVLARPGIYTAEVTLVDTAGRPYLQDSTLVSVEQSLLGQSTVSNRYIGPITLGEIRMELRDFPGLNVAWENAEFSDAEIVHAILKPIRAFNETLPRVVSYGTSAFPWRDRWLEGAVATLLRMAGYWYLRNSRNIKYGDNVTEDDKDKVSSYMQIAEMKWAGYLQFCTEEQVRANWASGLSSF
jgi:hypothetical protein